MAASVDVASFWKASPCSPFAPTLCSRGSSERKLKIQFIWVGQWWRFRTSCPPWRHCLGDLDWRRRTLVAASPKLELEQIPTQQCPRHLFGIHAKIATGYHRTVFSSFPSPPFTPNSRTRTRSPERAGERRPDQIPRRQAAPVDLPRGRLGRIRPFPSSFFSTGPPPPTRQRPPPRLLCWEPLTPDAICPLAGPPPPSRPQQTPDDAVASFPQPRRSSVC
ncbi:hypothetical protein BRADI_3g22046v3 [Brachypodium distachyon]|uniref:Uncharacterized protein n=1 Tax=Brachypodium distachyon TaxID=15368 RepID=A0A0Q3I6Y5_BRADI|nr:hypothetical protein BRADI_3g22046v3 [Brachypodium distachyon]